MQVIHNVPSYLKIEPYGRTQDMAVVAGASTVNVRAVAGDVLDFYFPKGYIDLSSLAMLFKYYLLPYSAATTGNSQALPKDTECMIQTLEVNLGSKRVNYINNYNQIFFLLSLYGFDAEFRANRDSYQSIWTNGRTAAATTLDGRQFACEKWLGLLGLPIVLDTHTHGQLHIRITLGAPNVTAGSNPAHSWGINDVFMRVKYYENYTGNLPKYIEFDDFKSIIDRSPTYNQKTTLLVNSSHIDYVLAKPIMHDYLTKVAGLTASTCSTSPFATFDNAITSWNLSINNNNIFKYKPAANEGVKSVKDALRTQSVNHSSIGGINTQALFERAWACGAELGFVSEMPEQVEIGFITEGRTDYQCFPLIIVKTTSSLEIGSNGEIVHKV